MKAGLIIGLIFAVGIVAWGLAVCLYHKRLNDVEILDIELIKEDTSVNCNIIPDLAVPICETVAIPKHCDIRAVHNEKIIRLGYFGDEKLEKGMVISIPKATISTTGYNIYDFNDFEVK